MVMSASSPAATWELAALRSPRFLLAEWHLAYLGYGRVLRRVATLQRMGQSGAFPRKTTDFRQHHDAAAGARTQR
jgi:hypothetical protein